MKIQCYCMQCGVIFFLLALFPVYAQEKVQPKKPIKTPAIEDVKQEQEKNQIQQASSNIMLLAGGGYFQPLGTESAMLDPSYCVMLMIQQDNIERTLFGMGGYISYTQLPDNTYSNAYIIYITATPFVTATFCIFNAIYVQVKAGPGLSVLYSKINNISDSSLSMTLTGGGGMYGIIGQHFVIGMQALYHYYFQIHASSAIDGYLYVGYMF